MPLRWPKKKSAESLGDDIGDAVAGDDNGDWPLDCIGHVSRKGGRTQRGAADAGDGECPHLIAASQHEFADRLAKGYRSTTAWWHDHDRAFGGQRVADVDGFFRRDHLDVVKQGVERDIPLAKAFESEIA